MNEIFNNKTNLQNNFNLEYTNKRTNYLDRKINNFTKKERLLSTGFDYLVNPNFFDIKSIKILSQPIDTSSESLVFSVSNISKNYKFVIKITQIRKENNNLAGDFNFPQIESKIYNIISDLIKFNITPHIYRGINYSLTLDPNELKNTKIYKDLNITRLDITKLFIMINETTYDTTSNTITFDEFLSKNYYFKDKKNADLLEKNYKQKKISILINILFQIVYTLNVFNSIKLKHNDLHLKNILIIVRNNNSLNNNEDEFTREYIFDIKNDTYSVYLPNIGLDVRIFDFDRSCLASDDGCIVSNLLKKKHGMFGFDCSKNEYRDIFIVIVEIFDKLNKIVSINKDELEIINYLKNLLENFFYGSKGKELLNEGKNHNGHFIVFDRNRLIKEPKRQMKNVKEILEDLLVYFPHKKNNLSVRNNRSNKKKKKNNSNKLFEVYKQYTPKKYKILETFNTSNLSFYFKKKAENDYILPKEFTKRGLNTRLLCEYPDLQDYQWNDFLDHLLTNKNDIESLKKDFLSRGWDEKDINIIITCLKEREKEITDIRTNNSRSWVDFFSELHPGVQEIVKGTKKNKKNKKNTRKEKTKTRNKRKV